MHQSCRKDAFARAMTQVYEGAPLHIECIVPAVRILVLPGLLDPSEERDQGLKLDLAVGQRSILVGQTHPLCKTHVL